MSLAAATLPSAPAVAMVGQTRLTPHLDTTVMVLRRTGGLAGFCTGVALARDVVLTAAHCVPKGADVRILLPGDPTKPATLPVAAVAHHPDYHPDAIKQRVPSVDLALVHVAKPLPDTIATATLARSSGTRVGAPFVAFGYGLAREGDPATSGTLRNAALVARAPLSKLLLWAEDPAHAGTGACTGDSGGPVSADGSNEVSAIMLWSAGEGAQACGALTQAVWLAPERAWIDRVMAAWRAPAAAPVTP